MSNPFTAVVSGLEWLGKEIEKGFVEVKKIITVVPELEADAATLLPEVVAVVDGAGALAVAAVSDGGVLVSDLEVLLADVESANISNAIVAFEKLISDAKNVKNFANVVTAWKNLALAYDKLGADGAAALKKLESDL